MCCFNLWKFLLIKLYSKASTFSYFSPFFNIPCFQLTPPWEIIFRPSQRCQKDGKYDISLSPSLGHGTFAIFINLLLEVTLLKGLFMFFGWLWENVWKNIFPHSLVWSVWATLSNPSVLARIQYYYRSHYPSSTAVTPLVRFPNLLLWTFMLVGEIDYTNNDDPRKISRFILLAFQMTFCKKESGNKQT